jgi:hypothetical protein
LIFFVFSKGDQLDHPEMGHIMLLIRWCNIIGFSCMRLPSGEKIVKIGFKLVAKTEKFNYFVFFFEDDQPDVLKTEPIMFLLKRWVVSCMEFELFHLMNEKIKISDCIFRKHMFVD